MFVHMFNHLFSLHGIVLCFSSLLIPWHVIMKVH